MKKKVKNYMLKNHVVIVVYLLGGGKFNLMNDRKRLVEIE